MGPVINDRAIEKIHSYTQIGIDEGAKLLTGGEVASGNGLDKGHYYRPTLFGDVDPQMRIAQEEIFGPTTALIRVNDFDEAIRVSNGIRYGLSSSIFTRDVNKAFRAMRDLAAGITYINAGTIGAEVHLPFGGTKDTGNGHREAGQAALDVFTEWKSIYIDYSGKLQKAQIDTVPSDAGGLRRSAAALLGRRSAVCASRALGALRSSSARAPRGRAVDRARECRTRADVALGLEADRRREPQARRLRPARGARRGP